MTAEDDRPRADGASGQPHPEPPAGESWPPWAEEFFTALGFTGTILKAAKEIGKHRSTVYEWFEKAPGFRSACLRARMRSGAVRERALQLAIEGTEEPVMYRGLIAFKKRKFYPSLIKMALDEQRPAKRQKGKPHTTENAREIAEATCDLLERMKQTVPPPSDETSGETDPSTKGAAA